MRIKLTTSSPLPKINCWFVVQDKLEKQPVHALRKRIAKDLELNVEASYVQLSMDGFQLLPQTLIKDLVRDGDLITIKQDKSAAESTIKKRKRTKQEDEEVEPTRIKKVKKKEKKKEKKKYYTTKSVEPVDPAKAAKPDKPSKSAKPDKEIVAAPKENKSLPFQGKPKTIKRNLRRRLLKQKLKAETQVIMGALAEPLDQEAQVQNLNISHAEPLQLIKKNKNKKKNHMKQMEQRSHVHYTPDLVMEEPVIEKPAVEAVSTVKPVPSKNPYGRAFVTHVESERNYKGHSNSSKHTKREYPIHRVPTLFYAEQGLAEDEAVSEQIVHEEAYNEETNNHHETSQPIDHDQVQEKPINYEQDFPEVNFTNIPTIGTKLAIKTLELTAAYTPEISDWKQVILLNVNTDAGQVTFKFLPGFGKATTKGGKFENKKKKRYDDWYEEQEEEEEDEEEESEVTFEMTDIFAMRNMA